MRHSQGIKERARYAQHSESVRQRQQKQQQQQQSAHVNWATTTTTTTMLATLATMAFRICVHAYPYFSCLCKEAHANPDDYYHYYTLHTRRITQQHSGRHHHNCHWLPPTANELCAKVFGSAGRKAAAKGKGCRVQTRTWLAKVLSCWQMRTRSPDEMLWSACILGWQWMNEWLALDGACSDNYRDSWWFRYVLAIG